MTNFNFKIGVGVFENGDAQLIAQHGGMAGACPICTISRTFVDDAEATAQRLADLWNASLTAPASPAADACNNVLRSQNKAYPRTCRSCGLGPCKFQATYKAPASSSPGLREAVIEECAKVAHEVFEGTPNAQFGDRIERAIRALSKPEEEGAWACQDHGHRAKPGGRARSGTRT